jgi:hypothetical protein
MYKLRGVLRLSGLGPPDVDSGNQFVYNSGTHYKLMEPKMKNIQLFETVILFSTYGTYN